MGKHSTKSSLTPPHNPARWVPKQKQQVLACILAGKLGFNDAKERYTLSVDELVSWYAEYQQTVLGMVLHKVV